MPIDPPRHKCALFPCDDEFDMTSLPRATIHLDSIADNWRALNALHPASETAAVVKADAYGLGAPAVSRALVRAGCKTFFVAYLEEGITLRRALGGQPDIFVLNGPRDAEISAYAEHRLFAVLSTPEHIALWHNAPESTCALHYETGMNRLGIRNDDPSFHADTLKALSPRLVMSHLACADAPEHPLNSVQKIRFDAICRAHPDIPKSLANSAGCFLGSAFAYDLLRPGIALYGGGTSLTDIPLKHAVTLEASIISVFEANAGEHVGYGATHTLTQNTLLATVNLGYADGILRAGSHKLVAYANNTACPVIGRVSMDLITIDVSKAHSAIKAGDHVEFLGPNAKLDDQAARAGTLSYELLTGLSNRVQRIYA